MSLGFHFEKREFEKRELFITLGNTKNPFKDYSRELWNDIAKKRQIGKQSLDIADIAEEYAAHMSGLKVSVWESVAKNTEEHAKLIIKEITKISSEHLELLIKLVMKNNKKRQNNGHPSGIYAVGVSPDTGKQICMVCAEAPEKLKRCGGCGTTCYCSAECQRADWKEHKLVCKTARNVPKCA